MCKIENSYMHVVYQFLFNSYIPTAGSKSQVRSGFGNIFTWYISLHLLQTKHLLSLVHFHQHCTPFCNMAKPTSIRLTRISVWNLKASFSISISPWEKVLQKIYILLSSFYFSRSKFSSLRVCGMYARNFFWTKFFEFSLFIELKIVQMVFDGV